MGERTTNICRPPRRPTRRVRKAANFAIGVPPPPQIFDDPAGMGQRLHQDSGLQAQCLEQAASFIGESGANLHPKRIAMLRLHEKSVCMYRSQVRGHYYDKGGLQFTASPPAAERM